MKQLSFFSTLLIVVFSSHIATAQVIYSNFETATAPCVYDTTQLDTSFVDWQVYQTTDNTWDGPIDSSICVSAVGINGNIYTDQFDANRALYLRYKPLSDTLLLAAPNFGYNVLAYIGITSNFLAGLDSNGNILTGFIIRTRIPDADSTGYAYRTIQIDGFDEQCFATEYFTDQYFADIIIKVSIVPPIIPDIEYIVFSDFILSSSSLYNVYPEQDFLVPDFYCVDTSCQIDAGELFNSWWGSNTLLLHDTLTYPSEDNITNFVCRPDPNPSEQFEITIYEEYAKVYMQPFTSIIGGLVEGSDSIRHQITIIDYTWWTGCEVFIDVFLNESVTYFFANSGDFNFGQSNACLMLKKGATVKTAPATNINYGQHGVGAFAMLPGSILKLGEYSTFTIRNRFVLFEQNGGNDEQAYVTLPVGSRLVFTDAASLYKPDGKSGFMRLNVYMNGGTLDDSALSPEERILINRIYPPVSALPFENLVCSPNPARDQINVSWNSITDAGQGEVTVFNIQGQQVQKHTLTLVKGLNIKQIDCSLFESGVYIIEMKTPQGNVRQKVVVE